MVTGWCEMHSVCFRMQCVDHKQTAVGIVTAESVRVFMETDPK